MPTHNLLEPYFKRELTDYSVFHNILTLPTDALLFSLVSESTQGGALGSRHSCTVDGRPVSPLTAETVTVSEEVGESRQATENTVTWQLPKCRARHGSEPKKG